MGNPKSFHYLNQSNCYELVGVSDAQDYLTTKRAMDIVGISQKEQVLILCGSKHVFAAYFKHTLCSKTGNNLSLSLSQDAIFRIVAAILHLGNIDFAKGEESDSAIVEDEESKFHLQMTADLLMCDQIFAITIIRYFFFFCMCCIC